MDRESQKHIKMKNNQKLRKLNLGCGLDYKNDWINADIIGKYDKKVDFNKLPLPFEDNEFNIVLLQDNLFYSTKPYLLIKDIHRILINGGKLIIKIPYWNSEYAHNDLTLERYGVTWKSFDPIDIEHRESIYININQKFRIKKKLTGILPLPSRLLNFIGRFVSSIAEEFIFEMEAIK